MDFEGDNCVRCRGADSELLDGVEPPGAADLVGLTAGDAVDLTRGVLPFVLAVADSLAEEGVDFVWLPPFSGDLVAGAFGLAVVVTGLLNLEGATDGVSFTSPSSSSSSELCTSSADLILDEALALVLLVVADLVVVLAGFDFFTGRPSRSLAAASRSLFFFSFASSAARAFFGSLASNLFIISEPADFAAVALGVPDGPERGVLVELMGFSSSLASSKGLGMWLGVEPLFV